MQNIFEYIILKSLEVGIYDLLIFVFALTLFYAIFKKYKILGESVLINGVLSFIIAFLIFGYPVIVGYSLTLPLVKFFTQTMTFVLLFFVGILIASMFYPDLSGFLTKAYSDSTSYVWIGVILTLVALLLSGVLGVMWQQAPIPGNIQIPSDLSGSAAGLIILLAVILIASSVAVS